MTPMLLHLSASLAAACVTGLWQGLAIAALTLALCSVMRGAPAALRHTVLLLSFAGVLVLPFVGMRSFHESQAGLHGLQLAPWIAAALALVWLAVALLRAAQLGQAWMHLRSVRNRAVPVRVQGTDTCLAGSRRAVLCSSPDVDAPTVIGFRSPRLLLPEWMVSGLSKEDLRQITLHECEHLRRGDDWLNLGLQLSLVLFPLNPALPWLMRTIRLQRELAVDEAVVARTAEPLTYATCLTRLAEQRRQRSQLRLALSAWSRKSELVQRVHALLQRSAAWSQVRTASALAAASAVLLGATSLLAHAPQLVHVGSIPAAGMTATAAGDTVAAPGLAGLPLVRTAADLGTVPAAVSPAHAVSTSFPAGVGQATATHIVKVKSIRKPLRSSVVSTAFLQTRRAAEPRLMRMAYVVAPGATAQADDAAVEYVPAIFYTSYAAVPVTNGWLLISL